MFAFKFEDRRNQVVAEIEAPSVIEAVERFCSVTFAPGDTFLCQNVGNVAALISQDGTPVAVLDYTRQDQGWDWCLKSVRSWK